LFTTDGTTITPININIEVERMSYDAVPPLSNDEVMTRLKADIERCRDHRVFLIRLSARVGHHGTPANDRAHAHIPICTKTITYAGPDQRPLSAFIAPDYRVADEILQAFRDLQSQRFLLTPLATKTWTESHVKANRL
jgi:hypothetical protein